MIILKELKINIDYLKILFRLSPQQLSLKSNISKVSTNSSGTLAIISDFDDTVVSVDLSSERVTCRFPEYAASKIACFAIHPRTDNVIIVYADSRFVECNSKTGKYTKFCANFLTDETFMSLLPKQFLNKAYPTRGVVFPRSQKKPYDDSIIFYDVDKLFVFDKSILTEQKDESLTKTPKMSTNVSAKVVSTPKSLSMTVTKKYEYLVHLAAIDADSIPALVAIEIRPETLESHLPPTLRQKKFGAM